jgi:curli biogenesis system outer membrane secretion channel CsgG
MAPCIAVTTFENRSGFNGQWELGRGMADLLVSELVTTKRFEILERGQLNHILDEIDRSENGYFRKEGRVDRGRLKNAEYLIRGVVTDFSQVSGGSLWFRAERFLLGSSAYTARVGLTLTIIEIESGRIIDSVQCDGDARARSAYGRGSYDNVHFGGDMFFKTPLGKATAQAIRTGLNGIVARMPPKRWEPVVAGVQDALVIVNGGVNRALKIGDIYEVRRADKPVTDPLTGDVISVISGNVIAVLKLERVLESASYAAVIQGGQVQRGDRLRKRAE